MAILSPVLPVSFGNPTALHSAVLALSAVIPVSLLNIVYPHLVLRPSSCLIRYQKLYGHPEDTTFTPLSAAARNPFQFPGVLRILRTPEGSYIHLLCNVASVLLFSFFMQCLPRCKRSVSLCVFDFAVLCNGSSIVWAPCRGLWWHERQFRVMQPS